MYSLFFKMIVYYYLLNMYFLSDFIFDIFVIIVLISLSDDCIIYVIFVCIDLFLSFFSFFFCMLSNFYLMPSSKNFAVSGIDSLNFFKYS